jgi:hypothetical protein
LSLSQHGRPSQDKVPREINFGDLLARGVTIAYPRPRFEPESSDFWIDDVRFKVAGAPYTARTDEDGVVLLKGWNFVEAELLAIDGLDVRRLLEIGVFQGGSAALWALLLPLERYVGIDLQSVEIPFPRALTTNPGWEAVRLVGGVSQDDRSMVDRVIDQEFNLPIDLIIDDGSHQYESTRRAFEVCFPRLRPGGMYIIEDWAWAHHPPFTDPSHPWATNSSLANLVLRLVLLSAMRHDIVSKLIVKRPFVVVERGNADLDGSFDIEATAGNPRPLTEVI